MRYNQKIIPDAFHGTCIYQCNSILQFGFQVNRDPKLRLGDGVYFYESSFENAREWVDTKKSCRQGSAVVKVLIIVNPDCVLDLHNKEDQELIEDIAKELKNKYKQANRREEINDAVVINYIAANYENIHMIRGTFTDISRVQKIHPKSRFSKYSQLVICVRNIDIIKNTEQVYP